MKNPIQMIKQCVEKEEPYFVLRGQDVCALAAIETYYEEVRNKVKDPYFIEEIEEIMKDIIPRSAAALSRMLSPCVR